MGLMDESNAVQFVRSKLTRALALAPDAPREPHVLGHDGDALGMDGAEVRVFEEPHQVGLRRLSCC